MTMAAVPMDDVTPLRELAGQSHAWPFEEARKIVARLKRKPKDEVIFETGYGPSGLPHIGTFGEVARTSMVRHAFRVLTGETVKTRLIAFSDDMDALRKVPDNVPNKDMLAEYLGKPLTRVPDPFSNEYPSFGAANNARLRAFLDRFGFDYEFASSTDYYLAGRFDETLLKVLAAYDQGVFVSRGDNPLGGVRVLQAKGRSLKGVKPPVSPKRSLDLALQPVCRDALRGDGKPTACRIRRGRQIKRMA